MLVNIPVPFGGTGEDRWAWLQCVAPLVTYASIKFGLGDSPEAQAATHHLTGLVGQNGWPCAASTQLGRFRRPGCMNDPCPFANLAMLKLLSIALDWRNSPAVQKKLPARWLSFLAWRKLSRI